MAHSLARRRPLPVRGPDLPRKHPEAPGVVAQRDRHNQGKANQYKHLSGSACRRLFECQCWRDGIGKERYQHEGECHDDHAQGTRQRQPVVYTAPGASEPHQQSNVRYPPTSSEGWPKRCQYRVSSCNVNASTPAIAARARPQSTLAWLAARRCSGPSHRQYSQQAPSHE